MIPGPLANPLEVKKHETVFLTNFKEAIEFYSENDPKGECVIVIEGKSFEEIEEKITIASKENKEEGKVSSFQAFCISTASRVGTGNIAGIAIAIVTGGPGAIFWMWLIALVGSASSFVESTLAQIYKVKDGKSFRGGPAYYIEQGLKKKWKTL